VVCVLIWNLVRPSFVQFMKWKLKGERRMPNQNIWVHMVNTADVVPEQNYSCHFGCLGALDRRLLE
jgi:hypothetical protein